MNYTNIQNGLQINGTGPITGITNSGSLSSNSYTLTTESISKSYADTNFLSANTSTYTQTQANANFISQSNIYTQAQANANFLSANTSYYTQTQSNTNFLSANTSSSYYTQTQINANFLSASTSYYTQTQANANFVLNVYASLILISGVFTYSQSYTPVVIKSASLTAAATSLMTASNTNGIITVSVAGNYLITYSFKTYETTGFGVYIYKNGSTSLCVDTVNNTVTSNGSFIVLLSANDNIGIYTNGGNTNTQTVNNYSLTVSRIW